MVIVMKSITVVSFLIYYINPISHHLFILLTNDTLWGRNIWSLPTYWVSVEESSYGMDLDTIERQARDLTGLAIQLDSPVPIWTNTLPFLNWIMYSAERPYQFSFDDHELRWIESESLWLPPELRDLRKVT